MGGSFSELYPLLVLPASLNFKNVLYFFFPFIFIFCLKIFVRELHLCLSDIVMF